MKLQGISDKGIQRIAREIDHKEAWPWNNEKLKLIDALMELGYGDWIAENIVERYLAGEKLNAQEENDISKIQKAAGFGDIFQTIKDVTIGKMDYGTWTKKLEEQLDAIGESIYSIDKRDLIDWHEEGYTPNQAIQLALQESFD